MRVRRLSEIEGTERDVGAATFQSRRLLLAVDGMGFSFHDTILHAGSETIMWYRYHLEAVYCIEGEGLLEETDSGVVHRIGPGTLYALNRHDRHKLRALSELRMICVFNPALTGGEVHQQDGSYPPAQSTPSPAT